MTIAQTHMRKRHRVDHSVASVDGNEDTDVEIEIEEASVESYVDTGVAPQDVSLKSMPAKRATKGQKNGKTKVSPVPCTAE